MEHLPVGPNLRALWAYGTISGSGPHAQMEESTLVEAAAADPQELGAHRYNVNVDPERQISAVGGSNGLTFVEQFDVPWAIGKQTSLDNMAAKQKQGRRASRGMKPQLTHWGTRHPALPQPLTGRTRHPHPPALHIERRDTPCSCFRS